jgi:hypothetical protein
MRAGYLSILVFVALGLSGCLKLYQMGILPAPSPPGSAVSNCLLEPLSRLSDVEDNQSLTLTLDDKRDARPSLLLQREGSDLALAVLGAYGNTLATVSYIDGQVVEDVVPYYDLAVSAKDLLFLTLIAEMEMGSLKNTVRSCSYQLTEQPEKMDGRTDHAILTNPSGRTIAQMPEKRAASNRFTVFWKSAVDVGFAKISLKKMQRQAGLNTQKGSD